MKDFTKDMYSLEEQIVNIENEALSDEQAFAKIIFKELEDKKTKILSCLPNKQVTSYAWTTFYDDSHADLQNKKRENENYYHEIEKCEHYLESNKLYIGHLSKEDEEIIFTENAYDYSKCDIFNSDERDIWIIDVDNETYKKYYDQWKTPQKYIDNEIRFSRNVDIDNKEVRNVVTIIDNINKNNKLYSTIFDNYLRESLIRNKNKKGIYSIIQTIQEKQDEIRFLEDKTNFAVQGCAGSGKTLILLHRIRRLLYNNLINSRNYILLVPSNKFKNYIKKDSFKNFRISSDNIIPIQEYFMASCNIKSNADQDTNELHLPREFLAHVYSKEFIQECYYEFFNKISEKANKFFSFIYKSETGNHAIIENAIEQINGIAGYALKKGSIQLNRYTDIKKLIDYIQDEKAKYKAFYEMSNDIVIDDTVLIYDEISFDRAKAVLMEVYDIYHTVTSELKKKKKNVYYYIKLKEKAFINLEHLKTLIPRLKPSNDSLLQLQNQINSIRNSIPLSKKDQEVFKKQFSLFLNRTDQQQLKYLHTMLFNICKKKIWNLYKIKLSKSYKHYWYLNTYCKYLIEGNTDTDTIEYIFIDEAQDLSVAELELIYKLHNRKNKPLYINLFGDINQTITMHGIQNWTEINFIEDDRVYKLAENFRNTNQIVKYCNDNLPFRMEDIGVDMDEVSEYMSIYELFATKNTVDLNMQFIVKDESLINELKAALNTYTQYNIIISTVKEVKGLEFETVYVIDKEMTNNEKYIAYTRPLIKLNIIHNIF